jgi:hypothetical protein
MTNGTDHSGEAPGYAAPTNIGHEAAVADVDRVQERARVVERRPPAA